MFAPYQRVLAEQSALDRSEDCNITIEAAVSDQIAEISAARRSRRRSAVKCGGDRGGIRQEVDYRLRLGIETSALIAWDNAAQI
jgi:hypothetical protein